ncbi:hypothetical protein CVT25_009935 [Psilocybe cyanescens]|uniref:Uncharacterized protein n=1 Tax=Psilocybe cyanescens TaxID=93625 RepID=A0A409XCR9_PSICY|nr:hypothetical protein CVT25_009935 [Psilocybe cyanescens]
MPPYKLDEGPPESEAYRRTCEENAEDNHAWIPTLFEERDRDMLAAMQQAQSPRKTSMTSASILVILPGVPFAVGDADA